MSQEKIIKNLRNLGLTVSEAQIYIFLGKKGAQKAKDIISALKIPKQNLYQCLKNLRGRGLINITLERPAKFSAVPFERVLDLFITEKMEEANKIRQEKADILLDWRSIAIAQTADYSPKFTILEGRNFIYSRLKGMIEDTKKQLFIVLPIPSILRIDQQGLLDIAQKHLFKSKAEIKFLTEISRKNIETAKKLLNRTEKAKIGFDVRNPVLELKTPIRMIIRDDEEVVFFLTNNELQDSEELIDLGLWTNCKPIVQSFITVFEELWRNSTAFGKKIIEVETGRPTPETCVISEAETAVKKYDEVLQAASKEIMILTSSKGLFECLKIESLKDWNNKGVTVRIMASIDSENFEYARKLMKYCEVRHVPIVHIGATIVDEQHFFQFKTPTVKNKPESIFCFENTFYTNDIEYVNKTKNMLNDTWQSAQPLSLFSLKEITQPPVAPLKTRSNDIFGEYQNEFKKIVGFNYQAEPSIGKISEKDILAKIQNAVRNPAKDPEKDTVMFYGTMGSAIIYPPKGINLPAFIIQVNHYNKKSSFGSGNSLLILTQLKVADNLSYLPSVLATDNIRGFKFRKAMHSKLQSTEIVQLLKKNELTVYLEDNKLFAGWTVPIPLLPPKYILPPACLVIEGYGETKTYSSEIKGPMGRRVYYEETSLDAFVSFMHPSSSYHGLGTDAILHRDIITVSRPPSV